jgi:molybdopterin-guanine dinucleotide biosynthesis protein A
MGPADAVVAVLAGGRGLRLREAKPLAELGGRPLVCHVLAAARESEMPAVVVTKAAVPLPAVRCEVVIEPEAPVHPLCGLIAGLQLAERRGHGCVVAVACDMPFVTGPLLAWLATHGEREQALVARVDGRLQPLLGRYPISQLAALRSALQEGRSLRGVAKRLGAATVSAAQLARFGDPRRLCFNVNDADDLRVAHELLASAPRAPASHPT